MAMGFVDFEPLEICQASLQSGLRFDHSEKPVPAAKQAASGWGN
jgi:hypothetical protein